MLVATDEAAEVRRGGGHDLLAGGYAGKRSVSPVTVFGLPLAL
jgi:hypothetical protein